MGPERAPQSKEHNEAAQAEIAELGRERLKDLAETGAEKSVENQSERAKEAREVINKHETAPEPKPAAEHAPAKSFSARITQHLNYTETLASVQRRLKPASRRFSKVIHSPAVEKTSEVLEKTVMRPSVTLGATWTALIVGGIFYVTARHYGYRLSGFEMIASLIVGGLIGLLVEGVFKATRHRT